MTSSVNPASFSLRITCSSMGRPATGTKALGMWSVSGLSRVPSPAANIMAFIWLSVIGLFVVPDESGVH